MRDAERIQQGIKREKISKRIKQVIFFIAIAYLIWSIFVTILSVFTADKAECKFFQCNLIKFFNLKSLQDINNISKQINNSLYFGECFYKNERIDCGNLKISVFTNNNKSN
jgi:hypothetical protein